MPIGGFHLFTFRGIPVRLHWSWLVVAGIELWLRSESYTSWAWNLAEYVALFAIVLLHEFGHAFACRQVGGQVANIVLWPLGGVARVAPPPRPGAQLWSLAAGPLTNLVLVVPAALLWYALPMSWTGGDLEHFVAMLAVINISLFAFNMLPIYPLDGGQILRSLLWYVLGPNTSLLIAASLGLAASVIGGLAAAIATGDVWIGLLGAFAAMQCWRAIRQSRALRWAARLPPHSTARCPNCGRPPPAGPFATCPDGHPFLPYDSTPPGTCDTCGAHVPWMRCVHCQAAHTPWEALGIPAPIAEDEGLHERPFAHADGYADEEDQAVAAERAPPSQ